MCSRIGKYGLVRQSNFLIILLIVADVSAQQPSKDEPGLTANYMVDHPVANRWCPPIRSTFFEAVRDFSIVGRRRIRHRPNGGYGLPVVDRVADQHLLHVGADLGWYQVGEPVFAVADGIVRISYGPPQGDDAPQKSGDQALLWGNYVVIEHRVSEDEYVTAIYGHLGADRMVHVGDSVSAGQQIGTIGRNHRRINGGFKPHLHFGIRSGRLIEIGATFAVFQINGQNRSIKLQAVLDAEIEVELSDPSLRLGQLELNGKVFDFDYRDGKIFAPSAMLWSVPSRPGFELVGYSLSIEGWNDPVAFLREQAADTNPAPFRLNPGR